MVPQVPFRRATLADVDTLTPLRREYCAADHVVFEPTHNRLQLQRLLGDDRLGVIWLIEAGGAAVGYACVCFGFSLEFGRDAFLDELFVREGYRGRGLGSAALDHAIASGAALGLEVLHLLVAPGNTRARDLYLGRGFKQQDRFMLSRWLTP